MNDQIAGGTQFVARNFKKNILILSALMLGCSLFAGPVQASGDERNDGMNALNMRGVSGTGKKVNYTA